MTNFTISGQFIAADGATEMLWEKKMLGRKKRRQTGRCCWGAAVRNGCGPWAPNWQTPRTIQLYVKCHYITMSSHNTCTLLITHKQSQINFKTCMHCLQMTPCPHCTVYTSVGMLHIFSYRHSLYYFKASIPSSSYTSNSFLWFTLSSYSSSE